MAMVQRLRARFHVPADLLIPQLPKKKQPSGRVRPSTGAAGSLNSVHNRLLDGGSTSGAVETEPVRAQTTMANGRRVPPSVGCVHDSRFLEALDAEVQLEVCKLAQRPLRNLVAKVAIQELDDHGCPPSGGSQTAQERLVGLETINQRCDLVGEVLIFWSRVGRRTASGYGGSYRKGECPSVSSLDHPRDARSWLRAPARR